MRHLLISYNHYDVFISPFLIECQLILRALTHTHSHTSRKENANRKLKIGFFILTFAGNAMCTVVSYTVYAVSVAQRTWTLLSYCGLVVDVVIVACRFVVVFFRSFASFTISISFYHLYFCSFWFPSSAAAATCLFSLSHTLSASFVRFFIRANKFHVVVDSNLREIKREKQNIQDQNVGEPVGTLFAVGFHLSITHSPLFVLHNNNISQSQTVCCGLLLASSSPSSSSSSFAVVFYQSAEWNWIVV